MNASPLIEAVSTPSHGRPIASRHRPVLLALAALGLVAAACSDPPTAGGDRSAKGSARLDLSGCDPAALDEAVAKGPVDVDLWFGGLVGAPHATLRQIVEDFNQSQDDVVVEAHDQGQAYEEVFRKFEAASAAGQLPEMVYLQAQDFAAAVDGGQVLPAEACMEADGYDPTGIDPLIRSYYTRDGVLWPGYMNASTPVLFYNRNHWIRAGLDPDAPPTTLDELYEQARALKAAGVSDKPFVLKLDHWFFATWLQGTGIDVVSNSNGRSAPATEATFDTEELRELLSKLVRMADEGLVDIYAHEEPSIDHYLPVATQESSMVLETSTAASTIRDALAGDATVGSDVDLSGIAPMAGPFPGIEAPGLVYPIGGAFYILNAGDPAEQVASWRFMRFMLQPEIARAWVLGAGHVPSVPAVLDDPDVQAFWEGDVAGRMLAEAREQMGTADPDRPGPLVGPHRDLQAELERALEAIFFDDVDVDSALETAEREVTESLGRYHG